MTTTTPAILGGEAAFPDGLPLVRPTLEDLPGISAGLGDVLRSGMLTNGPRVRDFEAAARDHLGVRHVIAVSSCTAGLMLVLQAAGADGDVVLPSFTFSASAHVVHWAGGRPRWADIEADRFTLDPAQAAAAVEGASALLATHLYGSPCDVEALQQIADAAGVPLVYDAAHALGSRRHGTAIGRFGTAEVFSLSPTKVTIAGEGGLIATNDDAIAEACRIGRDYGNPGDYDCLFPGLNARMSELHATVGLASLAGLDQRVRHRGALVDRFAEVVGAVGGIRVVQPAEGDVSTYKDLTLVVEPAEYGLTAAELAAALKAEGIDSRRYYSPPVHRQKAYADLPVTRPLPITDWAAERVISPPLWSHMTEGDIEKVADAVVRIGRGSVAVRGAVA